MASISSSRIACHLIILRARGSRQSPGSLLSSTSSADQQAEGVWACLYDLASRFVFAVYKEERSSFLLYVLVALFCDGRSEG
jgi:hypothetical protein